MSAATVAGAPDPAELAARALAILEAAWRPPGFCVPNPTTYPWQWLWDSCFHAVCWSRFGRPDRAVTELTNALAHQDEDGFVPHLTYWSADGRADEGVHADLWGRPGTSSVTQPPMYGHAVAELRRAGYAVPDELVDRATKGLWFLLRHRVRDGRGPFVVHPWESGCDDSPRWDAWCEPADADVRGDADTAPDPQRWWEVKGELVGAATSTSSTRFEVASAGFAALVAFNARELATVTGDDAMVTAAAEVAARLDAGWSANSVTWTDDVLTGPVTSAAVRTLDALLPTLVSDDAATVDAALAQVVDDGAYGGAFGPAGVHRGEAVFDPRSYWRGPAWPQLTYLLWRAARRRGSSAADRLASGLVTGAVRSGFAEYWDPDTGDGLGAAPQSWTALAAVVAGAASDEGVEARPA
jgi:hypothetical protein